MKCNLVIFDLDGTLVSSHTTIYKSTIHALKELNIKIEIPEDEFNKRIGWHFEDIFVDFGFKLPDFENFLKIYKSVYFNYIDSSILYEGVKEILILLKKKNINTSLLTTKGQDQAELLINHFGLKEQFDYIMGRRSGIAHKPSAEPLLKICKDLKTAVQNSLIVGDTEMDIECGKNAGAATCAVTYGYRNKEELQKTSPDFLIDKIQDLEYIVDGM